MQFGLSRARWTSAGVYAACVVALSLLTGTAALTAMNALLQAASRSTRSEVSARPRPATVVTLQHSRSGRVILTQDDWVERIQRRDYWEGRGGSGSGPSRPSGSKSTAPSKLGAGGTDDPGQSPPVSAREASRSDWDGTYRTMCVRVCDGYFFPISFSTTDDNFERDQARCEASCSSPARLFVYKNPGEDIEEMKDLDGAPYTRLKTAFLYRQKYDGACKCTPHPWEPQAQDRHRLYALETAGKKGDKVAANAANVLKTKLEADERQQQNQMRRDKAQAAVDSATGSGLEGRKPRKSNTNRKSNPTADAAKDMPNGARRGDMMRLGSERSNSPIRSSGGKPTSASQGSKAARQQRWQAQVFENR